MPSCSQLIASPGKLGQWNLVLAELFIPLSSSKIGSVVPITFWRMSPKAMLEIYAPVWATQE